jgi:hypothetical protein
MNEIMSSFIVILIGFKDLLAPMVLAIAGASVHLFETRKGKTFRFFLYEYYIACFVSIVVFYVLVDYISPNLLKGILGLCGYSARPILEILERRVPQVIEKKLSEIVSGRYRQQDSNDTPDLKHDDLFEDKKSSSKEPNG